MNATFRSFASPNYRIWASGAIVSNVGTWMQRTAQDWIVLTQLTHNNATAVGITMALQFGPQLLLLPVTGLAADRFSKRKLLMLTQSVMGVLALGLGLLTVTHLVTLPEVYFFALLLGCAAAFDSPARQTFVNELVEGPNLSNAVALNSTSFNIARMIGPAVAGILIAAVGTGWVFLINAFSFAAVLISLRLIDPKKLHLRKGGKPANNLNSLLEGFKYIWSRPDLKTIMLMVFLIGTFGLNFPIFISTMAVKIFHADSAGYGLLTTIMAVGSVIGALAAAKREKPRLSLIFLGCAVFGFGLIAAALMPNYWLFGVTLVIIGIAGQTIMTGANSLVQLSTPARVRGRVMAIYLALALGGTPIGAPIVGAVADIWGPRWSLGVGAASGIAAAIIAYYYLKRFRNLSITFDGMKPEFHLDSTQAIRLPETGAIPEVETNVGATQ